MFNRREFIAAAGVGVATLAAPGILKAQISSGTPVINGQRVRRKLSSLADTDPFFEAYAEAIRKMHQLGDNDPRSWINQARIHADYCEHGTLEFFPWHRPYLHHFEKICGEMIGDPDFALPYWNWRDNNGRLPAVFFENGPLNVTSWSDPGQYSGVKWGQIDTVPYRYARADFGLLDGPAAGSFSQTAIDDMENAGNFNLLSSLTETPHGATHVIVGGAPQWGFGTMSGHFASGLSPLDPVFWLHHANVDRVWANSPILTADQKSALSDLSKVYSGIFSNSSGDSVDEALDDTFELSNYGYTYDFLLPEMQSDETVMLNNQILDAQPGLTNLAQSRGFEIQQRRNTKLVQLSASDNVEPSMARRITSIPLDAKNVIESISTQRLAPRILTGKKEALALENGKIFVRFNGVQPQKGSENGLIKVFLNCPYLSDLTPTTDPHYAGSICLFGCNPDNCGERSFMVELTQPIKSKLNQGSISLDELNVQLLPFAGKETTGDGPLITIADVELMAG